MEKTGSAIHEGVSKSGLPRQQCVCTDGTLEMHEYYGKKMVDSKVFFKTLQEVVGLMVTQGPTRRTADVCKVVTRGMWSPHIEPTMKVIMHGSGASGEG